ncbi:MAG: hypothetical protein IPM35_37325 [Myxococcales bacterium]|nr:hypothetical protein [Myxococcales bacterium]
MKPTLCRVFIHPLILFTSATALAGTTPAIQGWVKNPADEGCVSTPYGTVRNNCSGVVEVDLPIRSEGILVSHRVWVNVKWDGTGSQPYCRLLSIESNGVADSILPIHTATTSSWIELDLGVADASVGGTFVACWLNPGDSVSSYFWNPE